MHKTKNLALIGAGIGFCLAFFMSAFAYYASFHHLAYDLSLVYLCLAPTSYLLVVADWKSPVGDAIIVLIFALSNALIYGLVFLVIGKLWNAISK